MKNRIFICLIAFGVLIESSCMMHHSISNKTEDNLRLRDPVCGMQIDNKDATSSYVYKTNVYYFDSIECENVFIKNPEKFINDNEHHTINSNKQMAGSLAMLAMILVMITVFWNSHVLY